MLHEAACLEWQATTNRIELNGAARRMQLATQTRAREIKTK